MRNIILPSGRFFKPYSAYKDNHSLACYYTRIYRERNGEKEYPLSITISDSSLSIYWHGYQRRSNNDASGKMKSLNEDYGVHQIFSIDFNDLHKDAFEKWLSGKKLIPADFIDKHTYVIQEWDQTLPPTYSDIFLYGLFTDTDAQLVFKKFILDLYFDIKYSNLFIFHPRFESMIGFLMSIPLSKGIWLKAEYLWLVNESNNLQRKEGDNHVERAKFSGDKMEESGKKWLAFLRSQEGELATAVDSGWFEGVEKEHKIAYQVSDSTYLRKEAEDSVQWLLDRYDIYRAYRFQFFKVFSLSSLFLIVIASITSIIYIIHPFKEAYKEHAVHWFFSAILIISSVVVLLLWSLLIERIVYILATFIRTSYNQIIRTLIGLLPLKSPQKWSRFPSRDVFSALLSLPKIVNTIKPRILLASGAVWTFLFASNVYFLHDPDFKLTRLKILILIFLIFGSFMFMMAKFNSRISHRSHVNQFDKLGFISRINLFFESRFWELSRRGLFVFFLACSYSFIIGMVGMSIIIPKYFNQKGVLADYCKEFHPLPDSVAKTYHISADSSYWVNENNTFLSDIGVKNLISLQDSSMDKLAIGNPKGEQNQESNIESEYFNSVLPYVIRDPLCKKQMCYSQIISINREIDALIPFRFFVLVEPLIFFTFVAVAVGILLEMGLRIEDTGINFD